MITSLTTFQKQRALFTLAYFAPAAILVTLAAGLFITGQKTNFEALASYFGEDISLNDSQVSTLFDILPDDALPLFTEQEKQLSMADIDTRLLKNGFDPIFINESNTPYYTLSQEDIFKILEDGGNAGNGQINNLYDFSVFPETLSKNEFVEIRDQTITKTLHVIIIVWSVALVFFAWLAYWLAGRVMHPLEEALMKQKHFVSNAAHEFRTPLSLIKTNADVLTRDKDVTIKDYEDFRKRTVDSVTYLSVLTTKLLRLAHLDRDEEKAKTLLDVSEITKNTVLRFAENATEKKIQITNNISKEIHATINKEDYEQLLIILIDNALKYTPANGTVTVTLHQEKSAFILVVEDTGPGIPHDKQKNIFDRFYRADDSRSESSHGLGLAIAYDIVQQSKGAIQVSDASCGGAQFTLTMPR